MHTSPLSLLLLITTSTGALLKEYVEDRNGLRRAAGVDVFEERKKAMRELHRRSEAIFKKEFAIKSEDLSGDAEAEEATLREYKSYQKKLTPAF